MDTTQLVLDVLRQSRGFVSGNDLCRDLGVSRTTIWKHVNKLRGRGYRITSIRHRGHRLDTTPDVPLPEEIAPFLRTERLGRDYRFLVETQSTNGVASRLADEGCAEGTVVVADAQSGGRGRLSRTWFSPPSTNVYVSIVLRPSVSPVRVSQMALVTAVSLRRAILALLPGLGVSIKWPNDVLIDGRKVAGILCEMGAEMDRVRHLVIGVGVNVNIGQDAFPVEIVDQATSLAISSGGNVSRTRLLGEFLNLLEEAYTAWCDAGLGPLLGELRDCSALLGRRVTLTDLSETLEGVAEGLSRTGGLLLRLPDGELREVLCGDVHILDY